MGTTIKISHYVMIASAEPIPVVITQPAKPSDTILHVHRLEQSIDVGELSLQMVRDINYCNTHFNPGDPLTVNINFQPDVDELMQPDEYQDDPPDDDPSE